MAILSSSGIAKELEERLPSGKQQVGDAFALLREGRAALAHATTSGPMSDLANSMVLDMIDRALVDVVRAVPWDAEKVLDNTREKVVAIMKKALQALGDMGLSEDGDKEMLRQLNDLRIQYSKEIEAINDIDREMLRNQLLADSSLRSN